MLKANCQECSYKVLLYSTDAHHMNHSIVFILGKVSVSGAGNLLWVLLMWVIKKLLYYL